MSNNEYYYCKQILPWTRGLTNYLDNNWFLQCKYCSKTWLTCSVYPSIWGWKVDDNFTFTPNSSKNFFQNLDANWSPRSKMIFLGRPRYWNTWSRNNLVVVLLIIDFLHGMKLTIFVIWSTTTKMESNEWKSGRSMMKFMDIENHGVEGMGNG